MSGAFLTGMDMMGKSIRIVRVDASAAVAQSSKGRYYQEEHFIMPSHPKNADELITGMIVRTR